MKAGKLFICSECTNLIREIESYVWDPKDAEKGEDAPLKKDDHALDALRYAINTHKVPTFSNDEHMKKQKDQSQWRASGFRHPNDYGFR